MSSEWQSYRLGDLFELTNGFAFKGGDFKPSGVPVIKIKNVKPNKLLLDDLAYVDLAVADKRPDKELKRGDILITMSGNRMDGSRDTWVGKVAYFDIPGRYMLNQRVGILRPKKGVEVVCKCCAYFLSSDEFQDFFIAVATSSGGQANLSPSQILGENISLPPLFEQTKIASLLTALDDRITLLRETNATLEAIAQALFKSWFVDFDPVRAKQAGRAPEGMDEATAALFPDSFEESELGLVPKGWRVAKFGDFISRLSVGKKFDQKTALSDGNVPILDQGKSGVIGFHNEAPGVVASLDDPVVVFANHTCYMRLIPFPFSAIQNVLPFKGNGVDTVWAFYATKDRVKFSEYKGHWPDFAIEKTSLPDGPLTDHFRNAIDPLIRRMHANELQAQTLATLRDTLLPRLISGQLRLPEVEAMIERVT